MFLLWRQSLGVVRPRGCPYAPYVHMPPVCLDAPIGLDTPICLEAPICLDTHVWMPPVCLDPPYVWMSHTFGGIWMYRVSKHTGGVQTYRGHPNIWGCPNIWGIKMYGGIQTPHKSDKACFLCVVCSTGASNWVSQLPEGMCVKLATLFSQLRYLFLYNIFD